MELRSPTCLHIKLLSVFVPLFVHILPSKSLFPSFRLQIGWFSLPEQLLKIVFYLHCSVGGPLHHYLLPADDRMIGFLLGFSMVLLAKCYWKYSSKIFFFPWNLLIFQHLYGLESWGRILLAYFWEGNLQIKPSIFRFQHAGVPRRAKYLSGGDPDRTIGGAYRAMAHIGVSSLLFLILLRTLQG